MTERKLHTKKGKNFKEIIEEEKNKGKTTKKIMKQITHINSSVLYALSFLTPFVTLAALIYYFIVPGVFIWAGVLVGIALACSAFASYLTKKIKKQQWRYASEP